MDKDKIVNALNAIQNELPEGSGYHDELEVAIGVLVETSEDTITRIVQEIYEDATSTNA